MWLKESMSVNGERGFSLVEVTVVVFLAILLGALAVPNFIELENSFQRTNFIDLLENDIRRVRADAQAEGVRTSLVVDADGKGYELGRDFLPVSGGGLTDETFLTRDLGVRKAVAFSEQLIFDSRGYVINALGESTSVTVTLSMDGNTFCSGTVFPIGVFIYSC